MNNPSWFFGAFCLLVSNNGLAFATEVAKSTNSTNGESSQPHQSDEDVVVHPHQCGIYFAPSTVPGAGFGIFAGRDYAENEYVTPGDLVVPIVDWSPDFRDEPFDLWEEYRWASDTFPGMEHEAADPSDVQGASFGIGALPNCFHPMINIAVGTTTHDSAGLHRSRDPGAGAFTPYHGRNSYAWKHIPRGMELFVDYGAEYFVGSERRFGLIPTMEDYQKGDYLVSRYLAIREGMHAKYNCTRDETCEIETPQPIFPLATEVQSTFLDLLQNLADVWQSKTLKTVPSDPAHVNYVSQYGTSHLHYNRSIRSLDWLEENGLCMDNIKPGRSTIQQAGRGGFAARALVQGQVVAGMPLIHVPNRDVYKMFDGLNNAPSDRNETAHTNWQLMLNYCFGHRHSSLLLCPYGILTAAINHSQKHANVKIQWSEKATRHPEWFDQPIAKWGETLHSGLTFELIATRDIDQDEELLLDYGDEWEAAWQTHVANWKPSTGADLYRSASDLNQIQNLIIRTVAEGSYDPNDKILVCMAKYIEHYHDEEDEAEEDNDPYAAVYPCQAIDRYKDEMNDEYRYTVKVSIDKQVVEGEVQLVVGVKDKILHDFPREAFRFIDAPYSQDHCQKESFRHDMRIPDSLMPQAWLNRLEQ